MTLDDLRVVLGWAAAEGWNPGLDDAEAFFAADPRGFFVKEVAGQRVAAVSVVNHDAAQAFLGLYICLPEFRGQGHGIDVWRAAIAHAGVRCIGLDGVPDQQENYARAGFRKTGRTVRYRGVVQRDQSGMTRTPTALDALIRADAMATGVSRTQFAAPWFAGTATRQTRMIAAKDTASFAAYRICGEGTKIGPFYAQTPQQAMTLLRDIPPDFSDGPVFIDVPDTAPQLSDLLTGLGFDPVFETARMYTSTPPNAAPPPFYAVATLELG